jgi:hypothetical protein
MFLWIEFSLSVLAIAVGCASPKLGSGWFERAEQLLNRLAQKRGLSVLVVGLAALAARAALLPILPVPQPAVNDEFGYLLLADTFAHGRVTNPTHPMWVHFESFHIIWQPTYTAKFYPAQGLIMALGQVVMGHPFWGVWLSVGLMCAAICWMLQGWLPPGWALLGGFLAVIRLGTFSYWASSYWGGAVAATGGALVLGALPRIKRSHGVRDAILMGLGFAILANSRPYEGLFFGLPIAGTLAAWMFGKNRPAVWLSARRIAAPLVLVLVLTACAMGYYFWRSTGSPWRTPYSEYGRTYVPFPSFPWQSVRIVPGFRHAVLRDFYRDFEGARYRESRSVAGLLRLWTSVPGILGFFYLGPILSLPLFVALASAPYGFAWKDLDPSTRFLLLVCGSAIAGSMLPIWFFPHYAAPIASAILALVLHAMRYVRSLPRQGRPWGLFISRAVASVCLFMLLLRALAAPLRLPVPPLWAGESVPIWCSVGAANLERTATLARLEQYTGPQLAIVRYRPGHNFHREWVYNSADIDHAKVVWARDMGPVQNEELIDYFHDRHAWLVEADKAPPRVTPYRASP